MVAEGWFQQRRDVRRLSCFADLKTGEERELRHAIRRRSREVLTSRQTLVLAGATGAVWTTLMLRNAHDERERPFATLFSSVLRVQRWRFLAQRLAAHMSF